jgi:DEAD/DEAH box helicase domain-containing protein
VGFNIIDFDYRVLAPYAGGADFHERLPTLDILKEFRRITGRRVSLDHLAAVNIGECKTADGIQAVKWFREGRWDTLVSYCRQDVMITRKLFSKGLNEGGLYYLDKERKPRFAPLSWSLENLLKRGIQ